MANPSDEKDNKELIRQQADQSSNGAGTGNTPDAEAAPETEEAEVIRFRPTVSHLPGAKDEEVPGAVDPIAEQKAAATAEQSEAEELSQDTALFELLGSSLRPYWPSMSVAALLMFAVAGMNVVPPYLLQQAIDGPIARGDMQALWRITILYGATALGIFVVTFAYTYYLQFAAQRALADLRTRLFDHIFKQDYSFLIGTPTGDMVSRLSSDIDNINQVLSSSIVVILVEGLTFIVIMWVMFSTNWRLALLAIVVMPVLGLVTRYFRQRIRQSSTGERTAMALISSFLNEHLHGLTVVQLFGREEESEEEFDAYNSRYRQALVNLRYHSAVFLAVQEVLAAIGTGVLLYGGGRGVIAGWATLGMLVAFFQYSQRAFQPILNLSQQYNAIQIALGAAERIYRMLKAEPTVVTPTDPVPLTNLRGEIDFEEVHFSYVPDEPVLRGVNLHIAAGQSVAIVGATGAGKSSLASLLARYYDPISGSVKLDGIDLRRLSLTDLRRSVVVVPQDPICLAGSIRHNIRLFRDDINDEAVIKAAEFSNAAAFINQLPGGYDFELIAGGANLSQGQRQLLALARALALSPDAVLVLDEATSSIDTATEALIQDALERILSSRTSLVIAHRLSTVRNADRIIVMERGKVVEDGSHAELLELNGYYARLHQHQVLPKTAYPLGVRRNAEKAKEDGSTKALDLSE
ncbi:MAG TPA: ABC transporter ATP-binding protein [Caldilineaceae bacterium]|nr:ABC transporter ATP-binding protein [Caldilineaceae bacterium]